MQKKFKKDGDNDLLVIIYKIDKISSVFIKLT